MKLINALGGRKAVALWASLLVVLVLLLANRWIMPEPLDRATMIVDRSLGFLTWALGIFVGGNALEHLTNGASRLAELLRATPPKPTTNITNVVPAPLSGPPAPPAA